MEFTKKSGTEQFCRDAFLTAAKKFFALAGANLDNADRQVQNLALALFVNAPRNYSHSWSTTASNQQLGGTGLANGRAMAQDLFRQSQRGW